MKILLIAPQPFYEERGTPIAVRLLVETLCQLEHKVDLLVYHAGEDVSVPGARLLRAGRPPGVTRVPIGISWQKILCDLWLVYRMLHLLRTQKYDVIHAVEEAVFPAAVANLFSRAKLVYDMDSLLSEQLTTSWALLKPLRGLFELMERAVVRRATAVLAVCEDLAAEVRPWVGEQRVTVLPDVPVECSGVADGVESLRAEVAPESLIGLYVGNLERYQGIDLLVEAVSRLTPEDNLTMFVVGGDPLSVQRYRALAQTLGVADRLRFLGARPVAHLNAYLAQADILVSPRVLGNNTPMKIYSYMQSGRAILATDIRSHTQAIDPSCAELVPPEPGAMADGLRRLARDPELRARLGAAARERAESEYSLPVFRRKLRVAYEQMAHA